MRKLFILFFTLTISFSVEAKVDLPEIIGDNMVLQQNTMVRLWGWANPKTKIKIKTSWGEKADTKSDKDGCWILEIKTPKGSYNPQNVIISSNKESITLKNILIGEVWFAGGQSNMQMSLQGGKNCPVEDSNEVIANADSKKHKLRFVSINRFKSVEPLKRSKGQWYEFTSESAPLCSAVSYFFMEKLNNVLDVPIGIIICAHGGTNINMWVDNETRKTYVDNGKKEFFSKNCFNGMLLPIINYTIKGFIYYQGEANVQDFQNYDKRMQNMVTLWRKLWGLGNLPFYYVEIFPFQCYYLKDKCGFSAYLRELQCHAMDLIPNSGMISTNDLIEEDESENIHPKGKKLVGWRLAYWALNKTYGYKNIACESPRYQSMIILDNHIMISFTNVVLGYMRRKNINGFEICGPDHKFYPAQAKVDGDDQTCIVVWSEMVPEPMAVRYCFKDFALGNLCNIKGLPVIPFRTDNFEIIRTDNFKVKIK